MRWQCIICDKPRNSLFMSTEKFISRCRLVTFGMVQGL